LKIITEQVLYRTTNHRTTDRQMKPIHFCTIFAQRLPMERLYAKIVGLYLVLLLGAACNQAIKSSKSNKESRYTSTPATVPANTYQGYRVELVNVQLVDEHTISGTLINTGRRNIQLPVTNPESLLIRFDESLSEQGLEEYEDNISQAILQQSLSLEPGQIHTGFSINLESPAPPNSEEVLVTKSGDFQDYCPDLTIDTFFVSKRTKKYAEITYQIVNIGKGPAELYGPSDVLEDNVAIRAYSSGTKNLSRGDLILGGSFIKKGIEKQKGILPPHASFEGVFRIDLKKKTRHMPYIILAIDDYQALWECEERNNVKEILYR